VDGSGLLSPVAGGAAAWLPGNAGFVFQYATPGGAGATQLFVSDMTGTTRLLAAAGSNARVARDGSWVYYDAGTTLWRIHVDGTGTERVTTGPDAHPDPSPDGTRLAFVRHEFPGNFFQLAVRVLTTGADTVFGPEGFFPRWGPSGDTIAYWAGDQGTRRGAIWVLAADGSGARQVSAVGRTYYAVGLDWSPDGQWLLARGDSTLDLIRVATGLTIPLAYTANHEFASWRW
jgi:Tol biopolymer transport system component